MRAEGRSEPAESPQSSLCILYSVEIIRRYSWDGLQPAKIINSKWYLPNSWKNNVKIPRVHIYLQLQQSAAGPFATLSEAVVWKITPVPQFRSIVIVCWSSRQHLHQPRDAVWHLLGVEISGFPVTIIKCCLA